jgi:hypothetical protein
MSLLSPAAAISAKEKEVFADAVPQETTAVRRSTRCNKYEGFKPKIISDAKHFKSKVKSRKIPSVPLPKAKLSLPLSLKYQVFQVYLRMSLKQFLLQLLWP